MEGMMLSKIGQIRTVRGRAVTRWTAALGIAALLSTLVVADVLLVPGRAEASERPAGLGAAAAYSVFAASTVTSIGSTTLSGNLGLSPGTSITGFLPGEAHGATHVADAQAESAKTDVSRAYRDVANRIPTERVARDLGGQTLKPGVYDSGSSLGLTGTLTLDGRGNPNSVFVFQAGSTLTTASSSNVKLINGARASNVFWKVGSSATLGTHSSFAGTILALASITATTGTSIRGRALALNGAVTLDHTTVSTSR